MGSQLFLIGETSPLLVYHKRNFTLEFDIPIPELGLAIDVVSSEVAASVYISDAKNNLIHRVDRSGAVTHWSVGDQPHGLSVDEEGSLLVTCPVTGKVKIYTARGRLLRVIELDASIRNPWHTIEFEYKLNEKLKAAYLVSHGSESDPTNRLCHIDDDGEVLHCMSKFFTNLNSPIRTLAVGNYLIVADENNRRILMMMKNLDYIWTLVPELRGALRMWVDISSERLYVVINEWGTDSFTGATLNVYQLL